MKTLRKTIVSGKMSEQTAKIKKKKKKIRKKITGGSPLTKSERDFINRY